MAMLLLLAVCIALCVMPHPAYATLAMPDGTCTTDKQFDIGADSGPGLISSIVIQVQLILNQVSQTVFQRIAGSQGFTNAVSAAVTLYIAIYGILFTFGMVQITLYDFAVRLIKIGIMALLLSPDAWSWFSTIFITFFQYGTADILNQIVQVPVGNLGGGQGPFTALDNVVAYAVSAKMAVTLMAIFFTGPYGLPIGLLILMGLGSVAKSVMEVMWIILMAMILQALLWAVAPPFIACIMFSRTRHLFDGWLNQAVYSFLVQVFTVIAIALPVGLCWFCLQNLLVTPVCWTEWSESLRGTPSAMHYWRFEKAFGGSLEPFSGGWTFADNSPIGLTGVLTLYFAAHFTGDIVNFAVQAAQDIAAVVTDLRVGGESMMGMLGSEGRQSMAANSAQRIEMMRDAARQRAAAAINMAGNAAPGVGVRSGGGGIGAPGGVGTSMAANNVGDAAARAIVMTGSRSGGLA